MEKTNFNLNVMCSVHLYSNTGQARQANQIAKEFCLILFDLSRAFPKYDETTWPLF